MEVINEYPPIYTEIKNTFTLTGREIFTWGNKIYNPSQCVITPELFAHEEVHHGQQTEDETTIRAWWARYLVDAEFRLQMELEAHRVEYRAFCKVNKDRNLQSRFLNAIAGRLASPMYGNVVTPNEAIRAIKK